MIEFVLVVCHDVVEEVFSDYGDSVRRKVVKKLAGIDDDGVRLVRKCESVEDVRNLLKMSFEINNLVEFIGLGWRCVFENGRYYWSRIRGIEEYENDLKCLW